MKTRVISAVVAILILAATFYFFRIDGLLVICALVGIGMNYEFARLAFRRLDAPLHLQVAFVIFSSLIYFATIFAGFNFIVAVAGCASVFFLTMALLTTRTSEDLKMVLETSAMGILGFIYTGIFPGLIIRLLTQENGHVWLFALMAFVFSGDTFAYLAGRAFGKNKLLEPVSPKKTIEGSIGGLVGSAVAGALVGVFFLADHALWAVVVTAFMTGAFAQVGDLFESLIKRVAEVKDSGRIMPGHGGILDRIDGFIFAGPIYYILVRFLMS